MSGGKSQKWPSLQLGNFTQTCEWILWLSQHHGCQKLNIFAIFLWKRKKRIKIFISLLHHTYGRVWVTHLDTLYEANFTELTTHRLCDTVGRFHTQLRLDSIAWPRIWFRLSLLFSFKINVMWSISHSPQSIQIPLGITLDAYCWTIWSFGKLSPRALDWTGMDKGGHCSRCGNAKLGIWATWAYFLGKAWVNAGGPYITPKYTQSWFCTPGFTWVYVGQAKQTVSTQAGATYMEGELHSYMGSAVNRGEA